MSHDGDAALDDAADGLGLGASALQLHGLRATLFEDASCVADSLGDFGVVAEEGEIADDVGALGASDDGLDVVDPSRPWSRAQWSRSRA